MRLRTSTPVTRTFAVEADMLALIAAAAPELAGPGAVAVFEVQSAAGVPNVVATVFDQDVIAARADTGFVTDPAGLAALLALSDALGRRRSLDARQVAAAAGVTASYARSRVLPGLAARSLAVMTAPGRWTAAGPYRSPACTLVTIEAKLRDWRRGLGRAARHAAGADAAWLVLDGPAPGRPRYGPTGSARPASARPGSARTAPCSSCCGPQARPCSGPAVSSWPSGSPNSTAPARYRARWAGYSAGTWLPLQELTPGTQARRAAVPGEAAARGGPPRRQAVLRDDPHVPAGVRLPAAVHLGPPLRGLVH